MHFVVKSKKRSENMRYPDFEPYMQLAITEAKKAYERGEVPVGCVITDRDGNVIISMSNSAEHDKMHSSHAELRALEAASDSVRDFSKCTLYTTLEPCGMCAGAIAHYRVGRVIFGAFDNEFGCMFSKINLPLVMGHATEFIGGVCEDECMALLNSFFRKMRQ